jgi:adenylate cyclase
MVPAALKRQLQSWRSLLITASGLSSLVIAASLTGGMQTLEWNALDLFFRLRPSEGQDPRVVVVEINEATLQAFKSWPASDAQLTTLLEKIAETQPRVIGLDLYRDLPQPPGHQQLVDFYNKTPFLIGVEKYVGVSVAPSPVLAKLGQVAIADLIIDPDNKIRRGLIAIAPNANPPATANPPANTPAPKTSSNASEAIAHNQSATEDLKYGLASRAALTYLAQDNIYPQLAADSPTDIQLGKAIFRQLSSSSGGYQGIGVGGYQVLLNYRTGKNVFDHVAAIDLLNNRIAPERLAGKVVLVGVTAPSLNDFFLTPFNSNPFRRIPPVAGVYIHAHLTSQILSAAENGRPLLGDLPAPLEWLWIWIWGIGGVLVSWTMVQADKVRRLMPPGWLLLVSIMGSSIALLASGYGFFLVGIWVPIAAPLIALTVSSVIAVGHHHKSLEQLARTDELTQIANRRYFDYFLNKSLLSQPIVSLILCDVDFFKQFNDTYGHQAGDRCLQQVAGALRKVVRRSDVVARYGGEEFAVILPNTTSEVAQRIAERIRLEVIALDIAHAGSKVAPHVTLSCGVSIVSIENASAVTLIERADAGLYQAKREGRDRVVLSL